MKKKTIKKKYLKNKIVKKIKNKVRKTEIKICMLI